MYLLWLRFAAVFYASASFAIFPTVLYGLVSWRKICAYLAGLAVLFHFISVVEMLTQAHPGMPVGVHDLESLLGLAVAALFFLVWWLYDAISLGIFVLPATFFLALVPTLGSNRYIFHPEGERVSWLVAHIAALLMSYAALSLSLLASVLYLLQEWLIKSKPIATSGQDSRWLRLEWLPPLDTLERIAHTTLKFGFPCMTVGLFIGLVLERETGLGAMYFRDPKVVASFIFWGVYVLLLLVRRSTGLRGRKAACFSASVLLVMSAELVTMVIWATT